MHSKHLHFAQTLCAAILSGAFSISIALTSVLPAYAGAVESTDVIGLGELTEDERYMADLRSSMEIQSNRIIDWPIGPSVTAEAAILMDADTGTVLYAKNVHEKLYPASTTKMMTCLLAAENLNLNDTVTVTQDILDAVPYDGSNIGMQAGEYITVREALYAIMVGSANEGASAAAVKVAYSVPAFADMMNERAKALGCTDTHFVNANGLFSEDHYTSAYDLAMIARAFFNNEVMAEIGNTPNYHFAPSSGQPDDFTIINKHELINGTMPFSGIIGGKTGYLGLAGETLVTGAQRNGTRLICVVMKEHDPWQFEDTVTLFDYGFENFSKRKISQNDALFTSATSDFMNGGKDILGSNTPALSVNEKASVDLPADASFTSLQATIHDDNTVSYVFGGNVEDGTGIHVGTAALIPADPGSNVGNFYEEDHESLRSKIAHIFAERGASGTYYVNVLTCVMLLVGIGVIAIIIGNIVTYMRSTAYERERRRRQNARRHGIHHTDYYEAHKYDKRYDRDDFFDDGGY